MRLAGEYAYAGREWVCETVRKIIGADETYRVHNHHNFCWEEDHDGEKYFVVRKGATPAFPGQEGFVGGSMGDNSVILKGIDNSESKKALYSTVHGAGRVMSRTQAAGKRKWIKGPDGKKRPKRVSPGKVSPEMMKTWLTRKGVRLRGGGLDESPHAYRRLDEVLKEHKGTIEILHTLVPKGVVMAGENEFDPYKD
jgi:tRNA-splicing ligase RtcB